MLAAQLIVLPQEWGIDACNDSINGLAHRGLSLFPDVALHRLKTAVRSWFDLLE